jgi:hypothetical protein
MMRNWEHVNDSHFAAACGTLVATGQMLMTFIIHSPPDIENIVCVPELDDALRDKLPNLLGLACAAQGAVALTHVSEAWTLSLTRAEGESEAAFEARARATTARDSAQREEMLVATTEWRDDAGAMHQVFRRGHIRRNAKGEPVAIVALETEGGTTESRWYGLVPPFQPNEAERALAQRVLEQASRRVGLSMRKLDLTAPLDWFNRSSPDAGPASGTVH